MAAASGPDLEQLCATIDRLASSEQQFLETSLVLAKLLQNAVSFFAGREERYRRIRRSSKVRTKVLGLAVVAYFVAMESCCRKLHLVVHCQKDRLVRLVVLFLSFWPSERWYGWPMRGFLSRCVCFLLVFLRGACKKSWKSHQLACAQK